MKKTLTLLLSVVFIATLLVSCGGSKEKKDATKKESKTEVKKEEKVDMKAMMATGEAVYTAKCAVCHKPDGTGMAGIFPPLANADYLLADPVAAVDAIINGISGEIEVNGVKYSTPMAAVAVTKEEALAVTNYILKSFGNNGKTLTMADIKGIVKK